MSRTRLSGIVRVNVVECYCVEEIQPDRRLYRMARLLQQVVERAVIIPYRART